MSFIQTVAFVASLASTVAAHATVSGVVAGGKYYRGYSPSDQFLNPIPTVVGWSIPLDINIGPVWPVDYANPDIICHLSATQAGTHATIAGGESLEFQWTAWPTSHHGPVITYLANCNGPCESVDKSTLEFFKIDAAGLIDDSVLPGSWATDQLIANNNSWSVTIPKSIAPGNYVARHEIIALHSANAAGGAQNYPQCINLEITGTGTEKPAGTKAQALYNANDAGIFVDIYNKLSTYVIPGPKLYSAGSAPAVVSSTSTYAAATTTAAPVTSTDIVTSQVYTTVTEAATSTTTSRRGKPSKAAKDHNKRSHARDVLAGSN